MSLILRQLLPPCSGTVCYEKEKTLWKKLLALGTLLFLGFTLSACGNRTLIDTTYTFNYAQFSLPNGYVIDGRLTKWKDYDGEQIQLVMEDGNTYLVSSFNAVLSVQPID